MQFFADASTNSQPNSRAKACPSCVETSRSVTLSLLFPTSIMGTGAEGAADDKKVKMLMIPSPVGSGCETAEFV
jgi:hypothetical protein